MMSDSVSYEDVRRWYGQVPKNYFWQLRARISPAGADSFKVIYNNKGVETYWVEDGLLERYNKKEK